MNTKQSILFLSHGSPMTALGADELTQVWSALAKRLTAPAAILLVSAHWNTRLPVLGGSAQPETIHDFAGFPDELYALRYPAPGAPELAQRIKQQLGDAGFAAGIDASRGLDHGAWVPLRTLFPAADIPVLQLSVQPERCARHHYALGAALAPLADDNILIVASGHLTHNLGEYMRGKPRAEETQAFRDWVHTHLLAGDSEALFDWPHAAPHAGFAHPTPEHFLPLFVALGAAGQKHTTEWLGGGWVADSLAADNYRFTQAR
ncbi:MAG: dioxygenase [Propionivibrio sp.]|uniref:Dioxygenase n=1 Tax=Candidatus Propionivibrio dominans TaxID=2954373 RepID=A0A9D7FKW7_9RHOO|nr:dioxygenase [Candidatus Propionivibrio dominans]